MQRKFWLVAFASFTTACTGFWAYSAQQDRAATLLEVERQTATTARLLEEHADRAIEAGEHVLGLMAEIGRPEAVRDPAAGRQAFERLRAAVERSPQIGSAWVLSAQGENLLDSWAYPPRPGSGAERSYFREHMSGQRDLVIGPPETGSVTGSSRFTLSRPLLDQQDQLEAVAVVGVSGRYFEQFYEEAGLDPGAAIRLMTRDGAVLAAWPADGPAWPAEHLAGIGGRLAGVVLLPDDSMLAHRALPSAPVIVAVLAPSAPALAGWRERTARAGLVLAAAVLGFGLLAGMGLRLAIRERRALVELGRARDDLELRVQERTADLAQREAELRLVADALPALVSYIDADERYRFVNKAYQDWFGHDRATIEGRRVREVVGDEAYQAIAAHVARALSGERVAYQAMVPYRDGGARFVEGEYIPNLGANGRREGFYAFVTDISERRRAEAALRDSEGRYRALTEAIAAVIWTTTPDGQIIDMPQWRALTGQTVEEIRGTGWLAALHPDDREATREAWQRCVATGAPYDVPYRVRTRDGEYRWYAARGVPVRRDDGTVREWVGVCIDIHERKVAEERQALLMAELDHRVRNILASIQSMVSLTGRSAATKEDYAEALHGRVAAMARTHGLLTRGGWRGASVAEIIRDELEPYAGRGDAVVLDGEIDHLLKPRQALNFALVIHELATNAAKYGALSVPGGRVQVSCRRAGEPASPKLKILWRETGGPRVTKPDRRGFGSTLIESALREGTESAVRLRFDPAGVRCLIELPFERQLRGAEPAADRRQRADAAPSLPPAPALRGLRVLVVEDEMLVALDLRLALTRAGAKVVGPAATVEEAFELVASDAPSAAILDVNLGGERVDRLADRLIGQGVPVVFVTGYDAGRILPDRLRHLTVLQKPVDSSALVARLQRLVSDAARAPAEPLA
jgi:PAS domain S-box-containing protein